eukprot:772327-Pelagomonas_calceolata.AAC.7
MALLYNQVVCFELPCNTMVHSHSKSCTWLPTKASLRMLPSNPHSHNNKLFSFVFELMDIILTGEDQSQADQPNSLAEGPPV